jgi:hypothetical protein
MKKILDINVSAEGEINCFWRVNFDDGSTKEYYSIDQESPKEELTDEPLAETSPKLARLLTKLWHKSTEHLKGYELYETDVQKTYTFNDFVL